MDMLMTGYQFGGDCDASCCFDFVACKHPDLDASVAE